jgi:hypothetical protein
MYILLLKLEEDAAQVTYRFGPDEQHLGALRLNKADGEVEQLEPVPGQDGPALFTRAAVKIRQHWKQGAFPERTSWAS